MIYKKYYLSPPLKVDNPSCLWHVGASRLCLLFCAESHTWLVWHPESTHIQDVHNIAGPLVPYNMHAQSGDYSTEIERVLLSDHCSISNPPRLDNNDEKFVKRFDKLFSRGWMKNGDIFVVSGTSRHVLLSKQGLQLGISGFISIACPFVLSTIKFISTFLCVIILGPD